MMETKRRITKGYFDIACERYRPLVCKLSFAIGVDRLHCEELQNYASQEILKCLICYDGRCTFITFLYSRLSGTFRHMRDVENRARRMQSLSQAEIFNMQDTNDSKIDSCIIAKECLECLNKKEFDIIIDLYFNDKTIRMIGAEKGVAPSTICRIKRKALNKMKIQGEIGVQ